MGRWLITILCLIQSATSLAQSDTTVVADSIVANVPQRKPFLDRMMAAFDNYDTTYIEPNRYSWAFMMQNTNSVEFYNLRSQSARQTLRFHPAPGIKLGPYLGWKFIFLGYTIDLANIGKWKSKKTEFELSLYTSRVGCDIIYRRTGDDYRLRTDDYQYIDASGIMKVSVTGANLYYILNHRHFSYPAAMSQSTVQRRSAGSVMLGAAVTRHSLGFNYQALSDESGMKLDGNLCFDRLKYTDYSVSAGYGYNWVFRRNWLLCVSAMPSLGYKHLSAGYAPPSDITQEERDLGTRIGNTLNFDLTMRASVVWNNSRYFGGLALVTHTFRYRHDNLIIGNTFGNISLYLGLNFKKKKR